MSAISIKTAIETSCVISISGLCCIWSTHRDNPFELRNLLLGFYIISGESPFGGGIMLEIEFLMDVLETEIKEAA